MIDNKDGHIDPDSFIFEMKKRGITIEDLILLYEQYERFNSMAKREVEEALVE